MTSSYTILLLFQVEIHSAIVSISQDLVYFNHATSNTHSLVNCTKINKKCSNGAGWCFFGPKSLVWTCSVTDRLRSQRTDGSLFHTVNI